MTHRHELPVHTSEDGRWVDDPLVARVRSEIPLLRAWARKEYSARYRQSALGIGWGIAQPLATLAAFGFILHSALHVSSEGLPYIAFAYAGLVPWSFFSSSMLFGTTSLLNATAMVGKVYFPREVVSLAHVLTFVIDLGIATTLLFVVLLAQGFGLSPTLAALIPIYLVLVVLTASIAMLLSSLTVFVRDLRYITPLALQMLFIVSPVMYSATMLPDGADWLNSVNPIAVIANAVRDCALRHVWPDWLLLGAHGAVALSLFIAALAYTRSVEPRIADVA